MAALLLASGWMIVQASGLASRVGVPVERVLAGSIVLLLAACLLLAVGAAAVSGPPGLLRGSRRAGVFGGLVILYVGVFCAATGVVHPVHPGAGPASVALLEAHGPLTVWPAVAAAWPRAGLGVVLTAGRALLLVATAAAFAAAVALAARPGTLRPRRRGAFAAGACLPAAAFPAACSACGPPLLGLALAFGGAAVAPLAALRDPLSPAAAVLELSAPLLALAALLHVARRHGSEREGLPGVRRPGPGPLSDVRRPRLAMGLLAVAPGLWAGNVAIGGLPRGASTAQQAIYDLFLWSTVGALVLTLAVVVPLLVFSFRYRDRHGEEALTRGEETGGGQEAVRAEPRRPTRGRELSERQRRGVLAAMVVIPLVIIFALGAYSVPLLDDLETIPDGTVHVQVSAVQFGWLFRYPDGSTSYNELRVQQQEVIVLHVATADVMHSLFVPDLGVKMDAMPNVVNTYWFQAIHPGIYPAMCAEFCGIGHRDMLANVVVFPPDTQEKPYGSPVAPAGKGASS